MSIQLNTKYKYIDYVMSWINVLRQIVDRSQQISLPRVFFRYKTFRTHPGFISYYNNPPVPWRNWFDADLMHWINYPKFIDRRPFIVESNDHPLSAISWKKKVSEPAEVLSLIHGAKKVYEHYNCKAILIPCDGFRKLFEYYLPENIGRKLIEVSPIVCSQREIDWDSRLRLPITFCCLASDYYLKGVDLILQAWFSIETKGYTKLILACPNVPMGVKNRIIGDKSIILIEKVPLTALEKDVILRDAHISLGPTHIHGGANIAEGLEYGHVPLIFESHTKYFEEFGYSISMPYHFYSPEGYGKIWKTFNEFKLKLAEDKAAGIFDHAIKSLAFKMKELINNPEFINKLGKDCQRLSIEKFSSEVRNKKLVDIYQKIINRIEV